jgi:hypothetical protein
MPIAVLIVKLSVVTLFIRTASREQQYPYFPCAFHVPEINRLCEYGCNRGRDVHPGTYIALTARIRSSILPHLQQGSLHAVSPPPLQVLCLVYDWRGQVLNHCIAPHHRSGVGLDVLSHGT